MSNTAHDLAQRLGRQAEAVCRRYLSAGRRESGYWLVGDARNVAQLADTLSEHREFIESQGTLSERRRRNLLSEVLAIATNRMRRELEESLREDDEVRDLLDRVVSREIDPASAAGTILSNRAAIALRESP